MALATAAAWAGGGLGAGGLQPPAGGGTSSSSSGPVLLDGCPIQASAVTTSFVDAGVVATGELDLTVGGYTRIYDNSGTLTLKGPNGIATTGGSGHGDFQVVGDFYAGVGASLSIAYAGGNLSTSGTLHSTNPATAGTLPCDGGTPAPMATVTAGTCVCNRTTGAVCGLSGTTLTVHCVAGDTGPLSYICL